MKRAAFLTAALAMAACGEETPTGVGGPLLPGDAIRTFEIVLDAADYLESDTAFSGYTDLDDVDFQLIARAFEGVFDAHAMTRFDIPDVVAITDTAGVVQTDSTPTFVGGRVVVRVDTMRSNLPAAIEFRLERVEEDWDPATASWEWRVDSTGSRLPWSQPGGTGGAEIATLDWTPEGEDSLVFPVDSQTVAAWADTSHLARGAVLSVLTDDARIRLADFVLRLDARSEIRPDTIFTTTIRPPDPTFVFQPTLPDRAAVPLVSGAPGWRTFFEFRDGLGATTVPCPSFPGCRVRLDQTAVTYAALLLEPAPAPPGFLPQDSVLLETRAVYASDRAPLARSPLGASVGVMSQRMGPERFRDIVPDDVVEVPVTGFVAAAANADTTLAPPSPFVALLPFVEGVDFGVAAFGEAPRLRLVLTIATELQLR